MRRIMIAGVFLALELSGSRAFGMNWGGGLSAMGASMSDTAGALMQQELQRQLLEQQHQQQMQEIQAQHDLQMQQLQEQTRSAPSAQPTASFRTYTWPSGEKYVGEVKDGKQDGQGTLVWPSGKKYVGEWKDGKPDGQGTLVWSTGQKYAGQWKGGKRNGQGTNTLPDGVKYVGEWKNDKADGQGTQYAASGAIVRSGKFANGAFVK